MSRSVDERIVEMRFDNQQFERNVQTTMGTLDKLKSSLKLDGATKGLENVEKSAKNLNFDAISQGIEALQKRFSTFGIVGMRVIENLTDSAINFGKKAVGFVTNNLISGGKQRAMNIENAHFQLQALLKDEAKVQAVMDDAMTSVDGTAYAYDEAAKAASQFSASGIQAGEDMLRALNGITGVAAMTNSSYEDISRIFTTVAGNGRLMGDQLLQLSSKGLNAASTMSDFFNGVNDGAIEASESVTNAVKSLSKGAKMTEGDIRDFVSKGKISFEIFAEAMNDAFGEAAGRANETLTGAFSNMQAAIKKIGAAFYQPLVEQNSEVVGLLNQVRMGINDVKKELVYDEKTSAIKGLAEATGIANEELETMFANIKENGSVTKEDLSDLNKTGIKASDSIVKFMNGVSDGSVRTSYAVKNSVSNIKNAKFAEYLKGITDGSIKVSKDIEALARSATDGIEITEDSVAKLVKDGKLKMEDFGDAINLTSEDIARLADEGKLDFYTFQAAMDDAFGDVEEKQKLSKQFTDAVLDVAAALKEWVANLDIKSITAVFINGIESIKNIFKGIWTIIKPVKEAFREIFPPIAMETVVQFSEKVKELTSRFKLSEETADKVKRTFKGVFAAFDIVRKAISAIVDAIFPATSYFGTFASRLLEVTARIGDWLVSIDEAVTKNDIFVKAVQKVRNIVVPIFTTIGNIVTSVGGAIKDFFSYKLGLVDFSAMESLPERMKKRFSPMSKLVEGVKAVFQTIGNIFKSFTPALAKIGSGIIDIVKSVVEGVLKAFRGEGWDSLGDVLNSLLTIGLGVTITKLMKNFTKLQSAMADTLGTFKKNGIFGKLGGNIRTTLTSVSTSLNKFSAVLQAEALRKIAVSIGILALALVALSMIDSNKLGGSLAAVTVLFGELAVVMKAFNGLGLDKRLNTGPIIKMGVAIYILASALKKIAIIDTDKLGGALMAITVLIGEMLISIDFLSTREKKIESSAVSIIAFAISMNILASAVVKLAAIDMDGLFKGLMAVGALMTEVAAFTNLSSKSEHVMKTAFSLTVISVSLLVLAKSVEKFGKIDIDVLKQGLLGIGIILSEIATFSMMSGVADHVLKTAFSLTIISGALLVLKFAVEQFGNIDPDVLEQGLIGVGAVLGEVATFSMLSGVADKVIKTAVAAAIVGGALFILKGAVESFGSMDTKAMAQGLIGVGVILVELAAYSHLVKSSDIIETVAALAAIGFALTPIAEAVVLLGQLSVGQALLGVTTLASAMTILAVGMKAMEKTSRGAAAMIVASVAMTIMAGALTLLGAIGLIGVVAGLVGIAAGFALLGGAALLLRPLVPTIIALSGSIALLGLAVALAGAGLLALSTAMAAFAVTGSKGAKAIVESVETLVIGFLVGLRNYKILYYQGLLDLISIAVTAFRDSIPQIVETALQTVEEVLKSLVDHAPVLIDYLIDFIVEILNKLAERMPELIQAAVNFISSFFSGIVEALKGIDTTTLVEALAGVGIMAALMFAFNAIAGLIPGAMVGVLGMGAVLAEITLLIAAIGALAQLPGLKWLVDEGGELLKSVGNAIGGFVGSIIGGVLEGVTDSFPTVATNLSDFMENLQPFIDGAKELDASMLDGVARLADIILTLTGAEILDGLTSWLTGGNSLAKFGEDLAEFGPKFNEYSSSIKDVNPAVVMATSMAAETLAALYDHLPNMGGLADIFAGSTMTLADFGQELLKFAPSISAYSSAVSGKIDPGAVEASANAAAVLAGIYDHLPNLGGLADLFAGSNMSLADFGKELLAFGPAISAYGLLVSTPGIKAEAIEASANAAEILATLYDKLPNLGGLADLFAGSKMTLAQFADELNAFGPGIVDYSQTVDGNVSEEAVKASANAAQMLVDLANALPNTGGLIGFFAGDSDLGEFGDSLKKFGEGLAGYYEQIKDIEVGKLGSVIYQTTRLVDLLKNLDSLDTDILEDFGDSLEEMGDNGIEEFLNAFNNCVEDVETAVSFLFSTVSSSMSTKMETLETAGQNAISGFVKGMSARKANLISTANAICNSVILKMRFALSASQFSSIGAQPIQALITGITSKRPTLMTSIDSLINAIKEKFTSKLSSTTLKTLGNDVVSGLDAGMKAKKETAKQTAASIASDVKGKFTTSLTSTTLYSTGQNLIQGLINGINNKKPSLTTTVTDITKGIPEKTRKILGIQSPSKVFFEIGGYVSEGFANGIRDNSGLIDGATEDVGRNAINSMATVIARIADVVENGINAEPTIRPVLDLSEIQNGANEISGLFSKGIDLTASFRKASVAGTVDARAGIVTDPSESKQVVEKNFNFTQNNYSPKALSRTDIYRQTKNQFSAMKGAVSGA